MGLSVSSADNGDDPIFLDNGSENGFFQMGAIQWEALTNGTVALQIDQNLVVDGGQDIGATFSELTITVGVPEPSAAVLLLICGGCLTLRRR